MPDQSILRITFFFKKRMTCLRTLKTKIMNEVFHEYSFFFIFWAKKWRRYNKNSKFNNLKTLPKMSQIQKLLTKAESIHNQYRCSRCPDDEAGHAVSKLCQ